MGQGSITIRDEDSEKNGDLAGLNRDIENTEKELFEVERQEGNIDVTVDHRLLPEEGRADIADDIETVKEASKETVTVLVAGVEKGLEITADIAKELGLVEGETYTPEQLEAMGIGAPSPRPLEDLERKWQSLTPEQQEAMALLGELQESLAEMEVTGNDIGEINWAAVQRIAWDLDNPEGGPVAALQTLKYHIMDNPRLDEEYDNADQLRDATAYYFRRAEEFDNTTGMASNIASGGLITVIGRAGAKATAEVATTPATKKAQDSLDDASRWLDEGQPKKGDATEPTDATKLAKLDKPTQEMLDDPYHPDWTRYDGPEKMGVGADRVKNYDVAENEPTRFINRVKVVDRKTGQVFQGTVDLGPTLERIKKGGSFPHRNDGSTFQNRAGDLPKQPLGYYTEYVHPTPGISGPGPQRIVVGKGGEMYCTPDHYKTFIPINK